MDPLQRSALIERYRATRCDLLVDTVWRSVDAVPEKPQFLMSAWNPGGMTTSATDNARNDRRLHRRLVGLGLQPQRFRGRDGQSEELGWMFPYERRRSLVLLADFGQLAGVVWEPRGRSLLWAEGLMSPIDSDRCEIPDEDAAV
jgi:hypothetical protein